MKVGQRIAVHDQALWNDCTVMNPKKHNFVQKVINRLHRNKVSLDF